MIYIAYRASGGDPYIANRKLIVQDGVASSGTLINRAALMETVDINNYADWSSAQQIFGVNMLETQTISAAIDPFTSTGASSSYGRESGEKYCFECWVNIVTLQDITPSSFFFSWWAGGATDRIIEVGTHGGTAPKWRIRNGDEASIQTAALTTGEHFVQLNLDGDNYTLDIDGTQIYSGTNTFQRDLTGNYRIFVAAQSSAGNSTAPSTRVYVTPFRFTKGIDVPRGSIPTDLFPLS